MRKSTGQPHSHSDAAFRPVLRLNDSDLRALLIAQSLSEQQGSPVASQKPGRTRQCWEGSAVLAGNARCNMFPTDSLTRAQSFPRPLARYCSRLGAAVASTSCPACVRRHLRVGTIAPSLLSTSWEQPAGSSTAGRTALPAQITSACEKRSTPRRRTANILARADRQSMDSSVDFPTKPEKQVRPARLSKFGRWLVLLPCEECCAAYTYSSLADPYTADNTDTDACGFHSRAYGR